MQSKLIPNIKKAKYGDIFLFNPTRRISRIQSFIDNLNQKPKRYCSHVGMYWGNGQIIEAQSGRGVILTLVKTEMENYIIVRMKDTSELVSKEIAQSFLWLQYDSHKIVRILLNRLFKLPVKLKNERKYICSALVNQFYRNTLTKKENCTPVTLANAIL